MSIAQISDADRPYVHAWNHIAGVGAQKFFLLAAHFPSFAAAWNAPAEELERAGLSSARALHVVHIRPTINVDALWQTCLTADITLLTPADAAFPPALIGIPSAPYTLYVRGNHDAAVRGGVTIVGSRKISDYGMRVTRLFAQECADAGLSVISGLALGTDAAAHTATVDAGGTTVAILGGGIDDATITPRSHLRLAHTILRTGGALVSEYPPHTTPSRGTFPARNRLMAALADAVVIIEAAADSGTLLTAQWARTYGKKLFAVPGSIFADGAVGPNTLIRAGHATAALTPADVIAACDGAAPVVQPLRANTTPRFTDPLHAALHTLIAAEADGIHINTLIKKRSNDATDIPAALMMMELAGTIENLGNQTYVVRK